MRRRLFGPHRISSPDVARTLGVETVHQNLSLIDSLNVVENLFLNREYTRGGPFGSRMGLLHKKKMYRECQATLARLGISIPSLRKPVGLLSGGRRQAIAIGRAVAWGQKIVLLDEPAAALGVEQAQRVLAVIGNPSRPARRPRSIRPPPPASRC